MELREVFSGYNYCNYVGASNLVSAVKKNKYQINSTLEKKIRKYKDLTDAKQYCACRRVWNKFLEFICVYFPFTNYTKKRDKAFAAIIEAGDRLNASSQAINQIASQTLPATSSLGEVNSDTTSTPAETPKTDFTDQAENTSDISDIEEEDSDVGHTSSSTVTSTDASPVRAEDADSDDELNSDTQTPLQDLEAAKPTEPAPVPVQLQTPSKEQITANKILSTMNYAACREAITLLIQFHTPVTVTTMSHLNGNPWIKARMAAEKITTKPTITQCALFRKELWRQIDETLVKTKHPISYSSATALKEQINDYLIETNGITKANKKLALTNNNWLNSRLPIVPGSRSGKKLIERDYLNFVILPELDNAIDAGPTS